jgi:hypothetical protein
MESHPFGGQPTFYDKTPETPKMFRTPDLVNARDDSREA